MRSRERAPPLSISRIWAPVSLFGAVIAWAVVQMSPWTPESLHNPEWADTARILGQEVQGYISVDPRATGTAIMRLLSYAGIFWLALQFGRSSENARLVFVAVIVAGVIYAGYGIGVELSGAEKILWFDKERYRDSLTSTFRYKNGFATYAGMVLICATALLVQAFAETNYAGSRHPGKNPRFPQSAVRAHLVLAWRDRGGVFRPVTVEFPGRLIRHVNRGLCFIRLSQAGQKHFDHLPSIVFFGRSLGRRRFSFDRRRHRHGSPGQQR